ncbi:hypothetical protein F4680DRAFT_149438 [Xylaria scruposa]|nr:hypothetical protein F4680DRAFT_149438 [Xylaria scruposa]
MLDTVTIAGTVGTWVAVLLTFITLTAVIGPWLLLRQAYNARNRALNSVQDCGQDYVSKGIGFSRSLRFFRKTKVPSLAPNFDSWSHDIPLKIPSTNECWTAKYPDPTTCRTGWAVFCRLLEAYSASQGHDDTKTSSHRRWWRFTLGQPKSPPQSTECPVVLPEDGRLVFKHSYTFLPVSRYWILVVGLLGRYARREDRGKAQMPTSLRRDLNEERAYVEQHDINDIETALSKSDKVGFEFAAATSRQRLSRWQPRRRSTSADSYASSRSRVTDVSVPLIVADTSLGTTTLCGITGEFCRVMSDDVPPCTLMFTPHNRYEMGLTLPMTESVSISTMFWLANGFLPVFSDAGNKQIVRVICLEDPNGYFYQQGDKIEVRELDELDELDELEELEDEINDAIRARNSRTRERPTVPVENTEEHVPLNEPGLDTRTAPDLESVLIPSDDVVDEFEIDMPEVYGRYTDEHGETQSRGITGWELVLYTSGNEDGQGIQKYSEPEEGTPESYRSFRTRSRSPRESKSPDRSRSFSRHPPRNRIVSPSIRRARFDKTWTHTYRSRSPVNRRYRRRSRSLSGSRRLPPVVRKITLSRATDCPKSLNLAMEALQLQFTCIDSMTFSNASPSSWLDSFIAEFSDPTNPPDDDDSTNVDIDDSQEWIVIESPSSDTEYHISRIDMQTMVLAMLDIPWDPRNYLIGCQSRTTLWLMHMKQMSRLTEAALGAFKQLSWIQDPVMNKRVRDQSWLAKNPRASQPNTALGVDFDRFLTAVMRERKLQYKAMALGIITNEAAHSFVRSILLYYDLYDSIDVQLSLNMESCEWRGNRRRRNFLCKFIPESLIKYEDRKEKEDAVLVEDVVLVSLWACIRAELWLGSLNGDDLMDVVRDLKRTVHLI